MRWPKLAHQAAAEGRKGIGRRKREGVERKRKRKRKKRKKRK